MSLTLQLRSKIPRDCTKINLSISSKGDIYAVYSSSSLAAEVFSHQNGQLKSIKTLPTKEKHSYSGSINFTYFTLINSTMGVVQLFNSDLQLIKEITFPQAQNLQGSKLDSDSKLISISYTIANLSKIKILTLPQLNGIQEIEVPEEIRSTSIFQLLNAKKQKSTYLLAIGFIDNLERLLLFRLKKNNFLLLHRIPIKGLNEYNLLPINSGKEYLFFLGRGENNLGKEFQIIKFNGEKVDLLFDQKFNYDLSSIILYPKGKYAFLISGLSSTRIGQIIEFNNNHGIEIIPQGFGLPLPFFAQGSFSSDGQWLVIGGRSSLEENKSTLSLYQVIDSESEEETSDILDQIEEFTFTPSQNPSTNLKRNSCASSCQSPCQSSYEKVGGEKVDGEKVDGEKVKKDSYELPSEKVDEKDKEKEKEEKDIDRTDIDRTDIDKTSSISILSQETALEVPRKKDSPQKEKRNTDFSRKDHKEDYGEKEKKDEYKLRPRQEHDKYSKKKYNLHRNKRSEKKYYDLDNFQSTKEKKKDDQWRERKEKERKEKEKIRKEKERKEKEKKEEEERKREEKAIKEKFLRGKNIIELSETSDDFFDDF